MPEDTKQIDGWGKFFAAILLIFAIVFAICTLMAYWPNKMPKPGLGDDAWYTATRYRMALIETKDSVTETAKTGKPAFPVDSLTKVKEAFTKAMELKREKKDEEGFKKDSLELIKVNELLAKAPVAKPVAEPVSAAVVADTSNRIHLNTLLLILVATMGFLGNMIHTAASFTSFVGNETFKRSWIMWYFVKPFTAAGLALIIYFIVRAGFIGYGSDASSVSLYGVLCLAALAGLFTDNATLKLKEVFDVIFKPKDERADKLDDFKMNITSIKPDKIDRAAANKVIIEGKNFEKKKLIVKMNNTVVPGVVITATKIEFAYTVPEADKDKTSFEMLITDEAGKEMGKKMFGV